MLCLTKTEVQKDVAKLHLLMAMPTLTTTPKAEGKESQLAGWTLQCLSLVSPESRARDILLGAGDLFGR